MIQRKKTTMSEQRVSVSPRPIKLLFPEIRGVKEICYHSFMFTLNIYDHI